MTTAPRRLLEMMLVVLVSSSGLMAAELTVDDFETNGRLGVGRGQGRETRG